MTSTMSGDPLGSGTSSAQKEQIQDGDSFSEPKSRKRRKLKHKDHDDTITKNQNPEAPQSGGNVSPNGSELGASSFVSPSWRLSQRRGGRYLRNEPIFSPDEEHLILAQDHAILVFSLVNSLLVKRLEVPEPETICAYSLSASNSSQIYAISSVGSVYQWDWTSGEIIKSLKGLETFVGTICMQSLPSGLDNAKEDIIFTLHWGDSSVLNAHRPGKISQNRDVQSKPLLTFKDRATTFKTILNGRLIAVISGATVFLGLTEKLDAQHLDSLEYVWRKIPVSEEIRSLALQVREFSLKKKTKSILSKYALDVAIGGDSGSIMFFENILNKLLRKEQSAEDTDANLVPRLLHWHRLPTNTVQFSLDGNYIISGGSETVLVLWQLDTGKRQFLPHMVSTIETLTVSPKGATYAIKLGDNSIVVLSTADLKPIASIVGLQARTFQRRFFLKTGKSSLRDLDLNHPVPAAASALKPGQIFLAVPSSQIVPGKSAYMQATALQAYDIASDQHVARQALTRSNATDFNVGPQGSPIIEPDIKHITTSFDGQWLASVDRWAQPADDLKASRPETADGTRRNSSTETYFKLWSWSMERGQWSLVTRIDNPHPRKGLTSGRILDVKSHPRQTCFVSLGDDGSLRFWSTKARIRDGVVVKVEGRTQFNWACTHVVRLDSSCIHESPSLVHGSMSFSEDGSVLAVAWNCSASPCDGTVYFVDTISRSVAFVRHSLYSQVPVRIGILNKHLIVLSKELRTYDLINDRLGFVISAEVAENTTKDKPRFHLLRQLAVHPASGTYAIVVPYPENKSIPGRTQEVCTVTSQVAVFEPSSPKPLFTRRLALPVTSLTTSQTGFTLIDTALNVRILSQGGGVNVTAPTIDTTPVNRSIFRNTFGTSRDGEADQVAIARARSGGNSVDQVPEVDSIAEDSSNVNGRNKLARISGGQLSDLLGAGPSYALPQVAHMFEKVASLAIGR